MRVFECIYMVLTFSIAAFSFRTIPLKRVMNMCRSRSEETRDAIQVTGSASNATGAKFLFMYTCKICKTRNANMISKLAYTTGAVISTCIGCDSRHMLADNAHKFDMKQYGKRIDEYLTQKGEFVQKLNITAKDINEYHLVDSEGKIRLVPKTSGEEVKHNVF